MDNYLLDKKGKLGIDWIRSRDIGRKGQRDLFQKNVMDKMISLNAMDLEVRKSIIPIQHYIKANEEWSKWLMQFLGSKK